MICSAQSRFLFLVALCLLATNVAGNHRAFHMRRRAEASITITGVPTTASETPTRTRITTRTNDENGISSKGPVEIQSNTSTSIKTSSSRSLASTLPTTLPSSINGAGLQSALDSDYLYNGM